MYNSPLMWHRLPACGRRLPASGLRFSGWKPKPRRFSGWSPKPRAHWLFPIAALLFSAYVFANEATESSKPVTVTSLQVEPSNIELRSARDHQSVVVTASFSDGNTQDVTGLATVKLAAKDSPNAAVEYINETFIPRNDGSASVTFHYSGLDCKVDIRVTGSKDQPAIGFRNEVLPALTRAGCNTGKCHGSASGKDGFRLSLFGYDPAGDQFRLTREQPGRRIHLADPKNSLVVLKATGTVPHTGGGRIEEGSRAYESLVGPRSIWLDSCQRQMNTTSSCRINPPTNENASSIAFWIVQRFKTYGS